jgi:hypothetical protein
VSRKADPPAGMSWGEADRRHQVRVGLEMTPAERLRWLEETVEELRPWLGLAQKQHGAGPRPTNRTRTG